MTPDQIEAERVRFEARYSKDGCNFQRFEDGEYISGPTWCLFRGWLSRADEQYESEAAAELKEIGIEIVPLGKKRDEFNRLVDECCRQERGE